MIRETYFFRNLENLQILETKTKEKIENNKIKSRYEIIDIIELTDKEFSNNFKHNYKFLYKYIDEMKINSNGIWRCVQIKNGNKSILAHNSGYSYPRFTGLIL